MEDEEPIRIPITDVFDLHTVHPKEVVAVVEAYSRGGKPSGAQVRAHHSWPWDWRTAAGGTRSVGTDHVRYRF